MTSDKKTFLLGQLQEAIDQAVSESGRVEEIISEMKRAGYDLCLMLESTITISPCEDAEPTARLEPPMDSARDIELTDADLEFLQELNIAA
jgi:hypothetical protein